MQVSFESRSQEKLRILEKIQTGIKALKRKGKSDFHIRVRIIQAYENRVVTFLESVFARTTEEKMQYDALKGFLQENWSLIQETFLAYTSSPEEPTTRLLCWVALYTFAIKENNDTPCPLALLMPGVALESPNESLAPDLTQIRQYQDMVFVLRTHVLGEGADYLVPASRLIDLVSKEGGSPQALGNYYFDCENPRHRNKAFLSAQDKLQLQTHSLEAKALVKAKEDYDQSLQTDKNLLFYLRQLCKMLYFYSKDGEGSETNAGGGVYAAILVFRDYYQRLENATKNTIPEPVRQEIDTLLGFAFDKNQNSNATANLNTCIATRRQALEKAIKEHEPMLLEIGLGTELRSSFSVARLADYEKAKHAFEQALNHKNLQGFDKRSINWPLIETLRIALEIKNSKDFKDMMSLNPEEIAILLEDEKLQGQVVRCFETLDNLILMLIDNPIAKLAVLLEKCGKALTERFLTVHSYHTGMCFAALLSPLNQEKFLLLSTCLSHIVQRVSLHEFCESLFNALNDTERAVWLLQKAIATCKNHLDYLALVQCSRYFAMSPSSVYAMVEDKLLGLNLHIDQVGHIVNLMGIPNLDDRQRRNLLHKAEVGARSFADYLSLFSLQRDLSCEQGDWFACMQERLRGLSPSIPELRQLMHFLPPERLPEALDWFPGVRNRLFKSVEHFKSFLGMTMCVHDMNAKEKACLRLFFQVNQDNLPGLVGHFSDFEFIFDYLDEEKRVAFCAGSLEPLARCISSVEQIRRLVERPMLHAMGYIQRLIAIVLPKFGTFVLDKNDIGRLLRYAGSQYCEAAVQSLSKKIDVLINSPEGLGDLLGQKTVSIEQCQVLCNYFKTRSKPHVVTDFQGLMASFLEIKDTEKRKILCKTLLIELPLFCDKPLQVGEVLNHLDTQDYFEFLSKIRCIRNYEEFKNCLEKLQSPARREMACAALQDKLLNWYFPAEGIGLISRYLHDDFFERFIVCHEKDISSFPELLLVLKSLSQDECYRLCRVLGDKLNRFVDSVCDMQILLSLLSSEKANEIHTIFQARFPDRTLQFDHPNKILSRAGSEALVRVLQNVSKPQDTHKLFRRPEALQPLLRKISHRYQQNFMGLYYESLLLDINAQFSAEKESAHIPIIKALRDIIHDFKRQEGHSYRLLRESCRLHLDQLERLAENKKSIRDVILKWLVTIASLGIAALVSGAKCARETGRYRNRLFESPLVEKTALLRDRINTGVWL